jgi:tetratricopeptide (TPR) repeat protein
MPPQSSAESPGYSLRPRYRNQRPLDATLKKVQPGSDSFLSETVADQIARILSGWSESLLRSSGDVHAIAGSLASNFRGASLRPGESHLKRSDELLQIHQNGFSTATNLDRDTFLQEWRFEFETFSSIEVADFQIVWIDAGIGAPESARHAETRVRYEIVGTGGGFHREQRVGVWHVMWESESATEFRVTNWHGLEETRARSHSPIYVDTTVAAFGKSASYSSQVLHGTDYWRTVLDGACGIDIYGHNGVSVADIDNDGFDDLYMCQPAGLPNRLYRNRGDGTFEDITEASGLGILENTACALFADFDNDGRQDVIVVRNSGPLLYLNEGGGKFRARPDAFRFTNPPQGTFTGAAVADYDRDGWLDIYFCLYAYYQGTGQYRYPSPYHDAENGPPNFLMRNNRDGTFSDVTEKCGLNKNNTRYSFCCGWNDYNKDGWPDLYVVNDFGRKNLYRNNGDGTFTDVAAAAGVEDVGAGMSVSWLDADKDGAADLYVANMWTAAGMRVSNQNQFKKDSPVAIRALYQKHAMGNSLLHNGGDRFTDVTSSSGAGVGRWAWSSDAFDFDHDGYPDLYITNGMVSGPSRYDLNSFFWRQVVANSPDQAAAAYDYEQGWNAVNELIRSDSTWSGYERNVFYANNRDGTFSDVSGAIELDFVEDGRSFALGDFDHDGRLEILLKNRNAPQLRLLKNVVTDLPPSISFRLQGKRSNRDAIGAVITVGSDTGRQMRELQAGSGFLSQHSKEVLFGLGNTKSTVRASIRWPSGLVQQLDNLPLNHRILVEEGATDYRAEPFGPSSSVHPVIRQQPELLPVKVETWLLSPVPAPDFSLPESSGTLKRLSETRGKPTLLHFWTSQSNDGETDLRLFEDCHARWAARGLQLIAVNVDDIAAGAAQNGAVEKRLQGSFGQFSFPVVRGSEDVAAIYNILYRQLFDRHRDIGLPTSFLIDKDGYIVKLYQGSLNREHLERDFLIIPRSEAERLQRALPFPSATQTLEFGRNYLSSGSLFFQRGYLEQAEVHFRQALHDDPSSAEAWYGIGSVYLNQNQNSRARDAFERCLKLQASYPDTLPDAWNNLGVLATREGRIADSIECFQQALKLSPRHLLTLDNLGNAYRLQKQWDDARKVLELALAISPDDPEANYSLGMVYATSGDTNNAYEHLRRALKVRPAYPEALNNLGVLYLVTRKRDEAVASFEECIRVAPSFDQAYLNLARVYAIEGARDKARSLLLDLLKQHPEHEQAKKMLEQLQ